MIVIDVLLVFVCFPDAHVLAGPRGSGRLKGRGKHQTIKLAPRGALVDAKCVKEKVGR